MKLTTQTFGILKNFANINGNIFVSAGNRLRSINESESVYATGTISDSFPESFGIYDLNELLQMVQIMGELDSTEFDFSDKNVTIKNGSQQVKYWYAEKKVLKYVEKDIKMPEGFCEFTLPTDLLSKVIRVAGTLGHPLVSFYNSESGSTTVKAKVYDPNISTGTVFDITVGELEGLDDSDYSKFEYIFTVQNLKYLTEETSDYSVTFAPKITRFSCNDLPIEYYVSISSTSTLE